MVNKLSIVVDDESLNSKDIISEDESNYLKSFSKTDYSTSCYDCKSCKTCIGGGTPAPR